MTTKFTVTRDGVVVADTDFNGSISDKIGFEDDSMSASFTGAHKILVGDVLTADITYGALTLSKSLPVVSFDSSELPDVTTVRARANQDRHYSLELLKDIVQDRVSRNLPMCEPSDVVYSALDVDIRNSQNPSLSIAGSIEQELLDIQDLSSAKRILDERALFLQVPIEFTQDLSSSLASYVNGIAAIDRPIKRLDSEMLIEPVIQGSMRFSVSEISGAPHLIEHMRLSARGITSNREQDILSIGSEEPSETISREFRTDVEAILYLQTYRILAMMKSAKMSVSIPGLVDIGIRDYINLGEDHIIWPHWIVTEKSIQVPEPNSIVSNYSFSPVQSNRAI